MASLEPAQYVFLVAVGAFTVTAAVMDVRTRRIPNKLTVPFFALGLVYQLAFYGLEGLGSGLLAFAAGFGVMLLLWLIGGGGGGDVKLMGALAVWLGLPLTIAVFVVSTVLVILGSVLVMAYTGATQGMYKAKRQYMERERTTATGAVRSRTREQRRIMAYALPVALATWTVVLLNVFGFFRPVMSA